MICIWLFMRYYMMDAPANQRLPVPRLIHSPLSRRPSLFWLSSASVRPSLVDRTAGTSSFHIATGLAERHWLAFNGRETLLLNRYHAGGNGNLLTWPDQGRRATRPWRCLWTSTPCPQSVIYVRRSIYGPKPLLKERRRNLTRLARAQGGGTCVIADE